MELGEKMQSGVHSCPKMLGVYTCLVQQIIISWISWCSCLAYRIPLSFSENSFLSYSYYCIKLTALAFNLDLTWSSRSTHVVNESSPWNYTFALSFVLCRGTSEFLILGVHPNSEHIHFTGFKLLIKKAKYCTIKSGLFKEIFLSPKLGDINSWFSPYFFFFSFFTGAASKHIPFFC